MGDLLLWFLFGFTLTLGACLIFGEPMSMLSENELREYLRREGGRTVTAKEVRVGQVIRVTFAPRHTREGVVANERVVAFRVVDITNMYGEVTADFNERDFGLDLTAPDVIRIEVMREAPDRITELAQRMRTARTLMTSDWEHVHPRIREGWIRTAKAAIEYIKTNPEVLDLEIGERA